MSVRIIVNGNPLQTLTDKDIYGGVEYQRVLNSDTNLQVGDVSSASIKFKIKSNVLQVGNLLQYLEDTTSIGYFFITDIVKGKTDYTITAYDAVTKLDIDCTDWKQNLVLPMTLKQIIQSLCTYVTNYYTNITINFDNSDTFANDSLTFNTNTLNDGLSFRQIVSYIAQCAGGFAYMDGNYLKIGTFDLSNSFEDFTSSNYKRLELADYEVKQIDAVWVGMDFDSSPYSDEEADIGVIYTETSDPENIFKIYNNPFLYVDDVNTEADIQNALGEIYDVLVNYTYIPFKLETFLDNTGLWKGQKITIDGEDYIPFSISWNKSGMSLESTGEPDRNKLQVFSQAEQRMAGKFNSFTRDLDETKSEIGNVYGQISTVSQTIDGVQITLQGAIDTVQESLDDHAERQLEYIRYGLGEGLVLGKEGDPIKARLTNNELAFINGQTKNAYISKDELYISKARVVGPNLNNVNAIVTVGEWQFIRREDKSLDIKVGS